MLNERQHKAAQYLGHIVNKKTRDSNDLIWKRNIQKNKKHYIVGNPLVKGLTAYLVGAGYSLTKNVQELKNVGNRGAIVAIDASLSYLIENDITPEYCLSLDASDKIWDMVKPVIKKTKNITLVVNTASNPKLVNKWLGPKFFFSSQSPRFQSKSEEFYADSRYAVAKSDIKKGDELKANKNYKIEFPGVLLQLPCGGNVTTTAHAFCMTCLKATTVVFVGCDFSWESDDKFYCGSKFQANVKNRVCNETPLSHKNIYGKRCHTNFSMHSFKQWHEQMAIQFPYTCINASEAGILGINEKGKQEIGFSIAPLKSVIAEYTPLNDRKYIKPRYTPLNIKPKQDAEPEEKIDPAVKAAMEKAIAAQGNTLERGA